MWSNVRGLRRYAGRRAVVQVGEQALDGTVEASDRESVVLTGARLLTMQDSIALDGSVHIPAGAVRWVQVI